MAASSVAGEGSARSPTEEARRLWRTVKAAEPAPESTGYSDALRGFLAFVEANRRSLEAEAAEFAGPLDETAMGFYRMAQSDLALRAAEAGLAIAPGNAGLLHHKALILLALNRHIEEALTLLDDALKANPHDKGIWATRGDALRLLDRPTEAADAYLRAQQLDATSTQYVERALKLVPSHPEALRKKVELARAHGGDRSALAAIDALIGQAPEDWSLRRTKAQLLAGLGDTDAAIAELRAVLEKSSDDREARSLLARTLLAAGRHDEGVVEVKALASAAGSDTAPHLTELAELVESSGKEDALAVELRQRIVEVDPRNLANLKSLRDLAMRTHRLDAAGAACEGTLKISPENLEALRGLAEIRLLEGKFDAAFDTYRTLLKAHPDASTEARRALEAAAAAGRAADILEFSSVLLAAEPNDVAALRIRAEALTRAGDARGALAEFDRWVAAAPDEVEPRLAVKQLLVQLGEADRLPGVYEELFRLDPSRTDLALERGNLSLTAAYAAAEGSEPRKTAGRTALVSYERASTDPACRGTALLGIGRASTLLEDADRAIGAYQEFMQLPGNESRVEVRKELGHALRIAGRLTEAEAEYGRAIQRGSDDTELLWSEVEVLSQLNQEGRAIRLVELLLQREPENPLFLRRKGQLLLKSGQRAEGLAALKIAVERAGSDPHALFEVAEALRAGGAYADAIGFYRQGLTLDPHSRPGRLALAETLLLAGQYPEAIPAIDTLLKEDANDPRAWRARADAFRALARPEEVLYSLRAILLLEPHNGPALLEKTRIHLDRGEKREAYDCLSALARGGGSESADGTLWLQLGDLAADLGETEEANRSYERAAQRDAAHAPEIGLRRARLRLQAGRPDLALEVLESAKNVEGGGESGVASLLLRAEILTALERPADAQAAYEEVRKREPRSPVANAGVARSLLDQGKHLEARLLLRDVIPQLGPQETIYLLLGEAETGLGKIPDAIDVLRKGVELLPRSAPLWTRLGELEISQERWPDAATAFAHAMALDGQNVALLLRAGFVADRIGHPNEALAIYERATQVAPSNKDAWCQRGVALLGTGRPEEALASFERSLALDSDFAPAKDGKKASLQKTREGQIERFGREGLLLEAQLHRPVTKNDLFVTLHAPFDLLEPVLTALGRQPKIDLDRLSEAEMQDLESASYHLITTALERRPEGIERRGFTLADVAVLSPPQYTLDRIQRLFGYLRAVLEADLRPENLRLAPDVEELARHGLQLPEAQRTLFQLVRMLRVGIYKARLIKIVEGAGVAGHAPVPALDLGQYSPEFRASGAGPSEVDGTQFFAPENVPSWEGTPTTPHATGAKDPGAAVPGTRHRGHAKETAAVPPVVRCAGCGGVASFEHSCGAALCSACLGTFRTCPKCEQAIVSGAIRSLDGTVFVPKAASHPAAKPPASHAANEHAAARPSPPAATAEAHRTEAAHARHPAPSGPPIAPRNPPLRVREATIPVGHPASAPSAPSRRPTKEPESPPSAEPPPPERPPRPAHRADEEPRL